jgi:DNA primase
MNAQDIKQYILENEKVEFILEEIGCQTVKWHNSGYWTCGNPPPSDNKSAITIYSPNLNCVNYTKDMPLPSDIISLIEFIKGVNFFQALKYLHEILDLDFYKDQEEDLPQSLVLTKMMKKIKKGEHIDEDNTPIKPIPETILSYYKPHVNDFWKNDNVPYAVQQEWELMYDEFTNRIIIPIRDEIGQLVGCKGRLFKTELSEEDLKYLYVEPTPRNKILYGLYKTYPFIKQENRVYCLEAEKSVHQLWSYGYKNSIATGGERVSKLQVEKIIRLNVDTCFAFDEDVSQEKIDNILKMFPDGISVFSIIDKEKILNHKQSPSDDPSKWEYLIKNNIYKIK